MNLVAYLIISLKLRNISIKWTVKKFSLFGLLYFFKFLILKQNRQILKENIVKFTSI